MSEIVRINASGAVGIVRATYLNKDTGEELVEVQIVGRATGPRSFVKRADLTTVDRRALAAAVVKAISLTLEELRRSASDEMDAMMHITILGCWDAVNELKEAIEGAE